MSVFFFFYILRYPFNWKTPFGYIICALIQTITQFVAGGIFVAILIMVVGFCSLVKAFILDIEENLIQLNEGVVECKQQVKMMKKLFDVIEFHSESMW